MTTYRVNLIKFDGAAIYRTHGEADPIHEYVFVHLDRDKFNALGKPGYLDVTINVATKESA